MKVLWDYLCLITHVLPSPFSPYHTTVFLSFFFGTTPTSQHFYLLLAFYNTTIPLAFLSLLCNYLRFSSPYICITLTPYTTLPYLDFILRLRFYSIFALPFYYCYNILDGFYPPVFLCLDYVSFFTAPFSMIFLPISVSPPFPYSAFLMLMCATCLFHPPITSLHLTYFQNIFSSPPYLTKG